MFREFVRVLVYFIFKIVFRVEFRNLENIPEKGSLILYANHISNADPFLLACPINRMVSFMAKDELFRNKIIASIIKSFGAFPIRRGARDIIAVKNALLRLKRGDILCMFPEGTRRKPGKIIKVKPGLAMIAIKAQCPLLPAAITGKPGLFRRAQVIFGKPIELPQYSTKELSTADYIRISETLMQEIDKLKVSPKS